MSLFILCYEAFVSYRAIYGHRMRREGNNAVIVINDVLNEGKYSTRKSFALHLPVSYSVTEINKLYETVAY
jgi:hypothetical protein